MSYWHVTLSDSEGSLLRYQRFFAAKSKSAAQNDMVWESFLFRENSRNSRLGLLLILFQILIEEIQHPNHKIKPRLTDERMTLALVAEEFNVLPRVEQGLIQLD